MSEFAPSTAPAHAYEYDPDDDPDTLDDGELVVNPDAIDNAADEALDSDDHLILLEGPGVTYPEGDKAWETPEAYSEEEAELEPRSLEELNTHEDLEDSEGLKQRIHEVAFDRISQLHAAKGQLEDGKDAIKQKYLGLKQDRQKTKYEKFERKAQTSLFQFQRERFAMKAKWAKRRLNATSEKFAKLENKHKPNIEEEKGVKKTNPSKTAELRIKRTMERRRELEKRRNIILEKRLVANYQKRLRGEQTEATGVRLTDKSRNRLEDAMLEQQSIDEFRANIKSILRDELHKRVEVYGDTLRKQRVDEMRQKGEV